MVRANLVVVPVDVLARFELHIEPGWSQNILSPISNISHLLLPSRPRFSFETAPQLVDEWFPSWILEPYVECQHNPYWSLFFHDRDSPYVG